MRQKKRRFHSRHRRRRIRTEVKDYCRFRPDHSYAHETEKCKEKQKKKIPNKRGKDEEAERRKKGEEEEEDAAAAEEKKKKQ